MVEGVSCSYQMNVALSEVTSESDPGSILFTDYFELLKERVIIDNNGMEIGNRLSELLSRAAEDARENQAPEEPFPRAIVRNALRILNYSFCATTMGGLPTGPAYERAFPNNVPPQNFGHEKVGYPMSDYSSLSFLPLGGLGAPLCEIDYATCYMKEGQMIQDRPIRQMTLRVQIPGSRTITLDLAKANGTYYALYPFSERTYDLPFLFSLLQFSPVIPGDYYASGLPVEIMELIAENTTEQPITLTFTINQENILGWYPQPGRENPANPHAPLIWNRQNDGNQTEAYSNEGITGLLFTKEGDQRNFVRVGSGLAGQIALASPNSENVGVTTRNDKLVVSITLQPGERVEHPIVVAYDTPFYNFQYKATDPNSPGVRMPKFYTRHYDATGQNAQRIAADALSNYTTWKQQILEFQRNITEDPDLPDFFKQALLNELYVLAETGIWEADQGRFAYLESIDYKMYNTSDVNSYTWAILTLFPELERKDLLELAKLVPLSDPRRRWFGTDRWANIPPAEWKYLYWAPVKDYGAVCHDLGGLLGQGIFPFTNTCNEFDWSNADMWIDLAPKFVLRSWRYVTFMQQQTGQMDMDFIRQIYPSALLALDALESRWGEASTHVPISKGIPDWTYDTISGHGYTPNVVTQWLGALEAIQEMAYLMGDYAAIEKYSAWFEAGSPVLEQLWNTEGYYNAFVTPDGSKINSNIHSDMLFGDFYARMCGLAPVVPDERATQSLETIYRINGEAWSEVGGHGPLGLANLRGPNGEQNRTEQGDEGWTGAMLLNAAYQIRLGMETCNQNLIQNGWNILQGFFNVVYSSSPDSQHWFGRTPEGYVNPDDARYNNPEQTYGSETGRAPKYMRALAIWAVYAAVKGNQMPFGFYSNRIPESEDVFPNPFGKPTVATQETPFDSQYCWSTPDIFYDEIEGVCYSDSHSNW